MQDVERQYFSLAEVARILGYEKSTIYSRVKAARIQTTPMDGRPRVTRAELMRYISTAARPAQAAE